MNGELADMVVTDPPYNVAYEGKTKDALTIQNDSMGDSDFYKFLFDFYSSLAEFTKKGGHGMFGMLIQKELILEAQ
jgi:site-specific DNA-methyltransferase (adenine-specific)